MFVVLFVFYVFDVILSGMILYGYYVFLFVWLFVYSVFSNVYFILFMAFYNRVFDADMGGTYMIILNIVSNFGVKWMESVMLFIID